MSESVPELVERFSSGDKTAFAELVRRYRGRIYHLAFGLLGNHLDADEVVQESFVRVYKRQEELANVRNFTAFLTRIATNYAFDMLRRRKGHAQAYDDLSSLSSKVQLDLARKNRTPADTYRDRIVMEEIYLAIEALPPRQQITAVMHDLQGFTKVEIAEALGCPLATVRSNLHIARTKLRKILKERLLDKE